MKGFALSLTTSYTSFLVLASLIDAWTGFVHCTPWFAIASLGVCAVCDVISSWIYDATDNVWGSFLACTGAAAAVEAAVFIPSGLLAPGWQQVAAAIVLAAGMRGATSGVQYFEDHAAAAQINAEIEERRASDEQNHRG